MCHFEVSTYWPSSDLFPDTDYMYHKILLLDVLNCLVSSVEMSCQAKLRKHYEAMGAPIVHKYRTRVLDPRSILHVYFFQLI